MFKHILVASDGSELAQSALTKAVALAKALNAELSVVWVAEDRKSVV